MWIKPKDGLLVRRPESRLHGYVPPTGMQVADTDLYWARLLGWGDVIEMDPPPAAPEPAEGEAEKAAEPVAEPVA